MFEAKKVWKYIALIAVLGVASYYGNNIKQIFNTKEAD